MSAMDTAMGSEASDGPSKRCRKPSLRPQEAIAALAAAEEPTATPMDCRQDTASTALERDITQLKARHQAGELSQQQLHQAVVPLLPTDTIERLELLDGLSTESLAVATDALAAAAQALVPPAEPLTAPQREQLLLTLYKDQYDYTRGQRLQAELRRRMPGTPISQEQDILQIASHFQPQGYHNLVSQLEEKLVDMEQSHQAYIDGGDLDAYQRVGHILRLATAPGLGKSTASRLLWVALHQKLKQRSPETLSSSEAVLQQRVLTSIKPNNLLLFQLDLSTNELSKLAPQEDSVLRSGSSSPWACILAWRLLYSVLHVSFQPLNGRYLPYSSFLHQLSNKHSGLLLSLTPLDVVSFVRSCAAIGDQLVLMAWALDEAHCFEQIPQLLSAFVQFRTQCTQPHAPGQPAATLPVCIVMSTLWSSINLAATASRKAQIHDIQLWPLNRLQMCAVLVDLQQRLQPNAASQHRGARSSTVVPAQAEWEPLDLTRSSELGHLAVRHPDAVLLLDVVGGNPRLLAYLVEAMGWARWSDPAEALEHWLQADRAQMTVLKYQAVMHLRNALQSQCRLGWCQVGGTVDEEGKKLLVKAMVTHAVTGVMVERSARVAPAASGTLAGISWEGCEQRGYITLISPATQAARTSEGGAQQPETKRPRTQPAAGMQVYVVMPPIMLSVLGVKLFPQLGQVNALVGAVRARGREYQDCAMVALRAWLAGANIPGMTEMSIEQLVCGRSSGPALAGQPSTNHWATEGVEGAGLPVLQQKVLLPATPPVLGYIDRNLDDQQFAAHVSECEHDHTKPYAWVGPKTHKADSWVFMRMPSTSPATPSSPAPRTKPLIIYISSKQRAGEGPDCVSKCSILKEAKKDVWSSDVPHVYVYVTDQRLAADVCDIADERIVVVGPLQHEAFYGSAWALVELMSWS